MVRDALRSGLRHVGEALREPEEFTLRWHRGEAAYGGWVWCMLALTAVAGTLTYGMSMGILGGWREIVASAVRLTAAAGLAWAIPLPGLYILNSLTGSRLHLSTTLLAVMVTVSWGGLAMMASIPINWFFTTAIPHRTFVLTVNIIVFAGVGIAMVDVFARVLRSLEPERRWAPLVLILLVGTLGTELFHAFGLFRFAILA